MRVLKKTEGYSPSDICKIVEAARRITYDISMSSKTFVKFHCHDIKETIFLPLDSYFYTWKTLENALITREMELADGDTVDISVIEQNNQNYMLRHGGITYQMLIDILQKHHKTIDVSYMQELTEWHEANTHTVLRESYFVDHMNPSACLNMCLWRDGYNLFCSFIFVIVVLIFIMLIW